MSDDSPAPAPDAGPPAIPLAWDDRGLIPAIAQDAITGEVLMVAWMNEPALALTRQTGRAHFFSRSRQRLWMKGESSGNTLAVRELRVDCDADVLLLAVTPAGPACHTNRRSCFFRSLSSGIEDEGSGGAPAAVVDRVAEVLRARRASSTADRSYTRALFDAGLPAILNKIAEEQQELADELEDGARAAVVHEAADLLFHVLVGLVARDIDPREVWAELERRFGVSGHEEKAAR